MQAFFSLNDVLSSLIAWMAVRHYGVNTLDVIILGVILFYSYEGYLLGLGFAGR